MDLGFDVQSVGPQKNFLTGKFVSRLSEPQDNLAEKGGDSAPDRQGDAHGHQAGHRQGQE